MPHPFADVKEVDGLVMARVVLRIWTGVRVAVQLRTGDGLWSCYILGCRLRGWVEGIILSIVGCCNSCVYQELWVLQDWDVGCVNGGCGELYCLHVGWTGLLLLLSSVDMFA